MQALALLCTLHADGPATLRRLHRAGCTSLQRLESYEPDELAAILEIPPAVARRLGREARSLVDRLDLRGFGDREEAPEIAAPAGSSEVPVGTAVSAGLDRRDRAVLGRVLDRWRTGPPPASLAESEVGGVTPAEQAFLEAAPGATELVATTPMPTTDPFVPDAPEAAPRLQPSEVDGLDEALCERLARAGVVDLAGLVEAEPLALSRDLGVAYARVRRIQFLASRALPEPRAAALEPAAHAAPLPQAPIAEAPTAEAPIEPPLRRPSPGVQREPIREVSAREVQEPVGGETPRLIEQEPAPRKFWEPRLHDRELDSRRPAARPDLEGARPLREGKALAWNFELHPPAPPHDDAARKSPARLKGEPGWGAGVTEADGAFVRGEEGAAGPFA